MNFKKSSIILIKYLLSKVDDLDWHAVSDAANDLRVLEAKNNGKITGDGTMAKAKKKPKKGK